MWLQKTQTVRELHFKGVFPTQISGTADAGKGCLAVWFLELNVCFHRRPSLFNSLMSLISFWFGVQPSPVWVVSYLWATLRRGPVRQTDATERVPPSGKLGHYSCLKGITASVERGASRRSSPAR